jgi:hypothetical protein
MLTRTRLGVTNIASLVEIFVLFIHSFMVYSTTLSVAKATS